MNDDRYTFLDVAAMVVVIVLLLGIASCQPPSQPTILDIPGVLP